MLPVEIIRNKRKAASQSFKSIIDNDLFDLGQENILDFDNSMNSFIGCCSFGTGHLYSFILITQGKLKLCPLLQKDSKS